MFLLKKVYNNILYKYKEYLTEESYIKVDYVKKLNNFGDILNPVIIKRLIGRNVDIHSVNSKYYRKTYLMAIGSILQRANKQAIVWGSGFIENESEIYQKPQKIYAVRGPKTRERLLQLNIQCPEVYGDPALLIPKFFTPPFSEKKYKIGIIPHYVDKEHNWLKKTKNNKNVLIIDVQNPDPREVIKQMFCCETIASSSLHGLIVSDAYEIPNIWIKFSNNVRGGNFKYYDYFATTDRDNIKPYYIQESTDIQDIMKRVEKYKLVINVDKLVESFPNLDKIITN